MALTMSAQTAGLDSSSRHGISPTEFCIQPESYVAKGLPALTSWFQVANPCKSMSVKRHSTSGRAPYRLNVSTQAHLVTGVLYDVLRLSF